MTPWPFTLLLFQDRSNSLCKSFPLSLRKGGRTTSWEVALAVSRSVTACLVRNSGIFLGTVIIWLAAAITNRAVVAAVRLAAATTDSLSSNLERLKVGIESLYLGCLIPILGKVELIKVELQGWDRQSTQLGLRGCQWKNSGVSALISPGRLPSGHVFTAGVGQRPETVHSWRIGTSISQLEVVFTAGVVDQDNSRFTVGGGQECFAIGDGQTGLVVPQLEDSK